MEGTDTGAEVKGGGEGGRKKKHWTDQHNLILYIIYYGMYNK